MHVVGLGDGYMLAQNGKGQSFLDVFVAQLQSKLGRPVDLTNLAGGDTTTAWLRESLTSDPAFRTEVAAADVIVISVGGNDSDPFGIYPKGTCTPKQPRAACLKAYAPAFTENYDAILASVEALRAGKPTAIRVTSQDNPFVGMPDAPSKDFGRSFYAQVAEAETAAGFVVAKKYGAQTIDYLHIFCGPDGRSDPGKFLDSYHANPGDLGIQTIADQLTALGLS